MTEQEERLKAKVDLARADRAKELLNNPLYKEAIESIEIALVEQFKDTKFKDDAERHELWQRMQILKQFQAKFEHVVKQGVKAQETLTLLERAKQTFRI